MNPKVLQLPEAREDAAMTETLYQRLGGVERITAIVEDAIDRHAVNPVLAPRFRGRDLPKIKQLGVQFFCAGVGGPQKYEGRDMVTVHSGMNISEQELVATLDDIVDALQAHGVAAEEVNEIVGLVYSLKKQVLRL
ncbi:MAG: group 1 truncated hemoglobin [Burkholderiaceae bacterium]|nr:group 1 truncated hemoglobin [Burkholderiaceae bacterium]